MCYSEPGKYSAIDIRYLECLVLTDKITAIIKSNGVVTNGMVLSVFINAVLTDKITVIIEIQIVCIYKWDCCLVE